MLTLILFLAVLSLLVLVHELGHFVAARIFGVKADEFGYGFPPRLIGFVKHHGKWKRVKRNDDTVYENTIWSLNWLPLGGFVRIKGEGVEDKVTDTDAFQVKPAWQRIIILAAGVFMNWVLAYVLFAAVLLSGVPTVLQDLPTGATVENKTVRITNVLAGMPAEKAGIQVGDEVVSVAGVKAQDYEQVRNEILKVGEQPLDIVLKTDDVERTVNVQPTLVKELGRPGIGVALADVGIVRFTFLSALKQSGIAVAGYTWQTIKAFGVMIRDIVMLRHLEQEVAGPVGIAVMTGQMAKQGIVTLMQFAAILSINLAVVNFLPIPALDGGRVLFVIIEKIRRKPVTRKIEAHIHQVAFIALIILILLVTVRDITKYGGSILGGLKNLVGI